MCTIPKTLQKHGLQNIFKITSELVHLLGTKFLFRYLAKDILTSQSYFTTKTFSHSKWPSSLWRGQGCDMTGLVRWQETQDGGYGVGDLMASPIVLTALICHHEQGHSEYAMWLKRLVVSKHDLWEVMNREFRNNKQFFLYFIVIYSSYRILVLTLSLLEEYNFMFPAMPICKH